MNWFDAMKYLGDGEKIFSSRLPDGSYIVSCTKYEGGLKLVQRNGSIEPWRPSGADQLSESWELKDN